MDRGLPEKLTVPEVLKKFPVFYETRKFITTFTTARHLSLSLTRSIQSMPPLPTSQRCILILSSHLRLGVPSGLLQRNNLLTSTLTSTEIIDRSKCTEAAFTRHAV